MDAGTWNKVQRLGFYLGIFAIFFIAACFTYNSYLTNEFIRGGDGIRIYPYLKYMEKVPERFPLWQAHKHHGYPLLADPINHMPLSLILDTESEYFNLHLNLVFFFLTSLFACLCYGLARMLDMSRVASLGVGLVTIVGCIPIIRAFMHGAMSTLFYYVLIYGALCVLFYVITRKKRLYLLLLVPVLLSWTIQAGYYLPSIFYLPAFIFLLCLYQQKQESVISSAKKSFAVLALVAIAMIFMAMPLLLPILDGIYLSSTFSAQTPTIDISDQDIYNYYFGIWPLIIFAIIYLQGFRRRVALTLGLMGSLNFVLILFYLIDFNYFFDLWLSIPVVKNIRHQIAFSALTSIAAAFCAGLFIDSCRQQKSFHNREYLHILASGCVILFLSFIAYRQYVKDISIFMIMVTLCFILMTLLKNHFKIVAGLFGIIIFLMAMNLDSTPLRDDELPRIKNDRPFQEYNGPYYWNLNNHHGLDKFSPVWNHFNEFSMVFMEDYRMLLSLLFEQDIQTQRPHWLRSKENIDYREYDPQIASLMGYWKPEEGESYFRVYDNWVVAKDSQAVKRMKQEDFSPDGPIILSRTPAISSNPDGPLKAEAELTGKTAETLSLHVETNKPSMVLVPEMYHRDWHAKVDGRQTPVIKAYASMRAIAVPPGEHTVTMQFVYWPFYIGLLIAVVSFIFMAFLIYYYRYALEELLFPANDVFYKSF